MTLDQLHHRIATLQAENAELRAVNAEVAQRLDAIIPALKWLLKGKPMRHPKTRRDQAIITSCEQALGRTTLPELRK